MDTLLPIEKLDQLIALLYKVGNSSINKNSLYQILNKILELSGSTYRNIMNDLKIGHDDLLSNFIIYKTDYAVSLGVTVPTERKIVVDLLAAMDPTTPLKNINEYFRQYKLQYQMPASWEGQTNAIILKAKEVYNNLRMVRILGQIDRTQAIFPYSKKYLNCTLEEIVRKNDLLKNTFNQILEEILDIRKVRDLALDTLAQFGHLSLYLENNSLENLMLIIYHEQKASDAIIYLKKNWPNKEFNNNDIKNVIALSLI